MADFDILIKIFSLTILAFGVVMILTPVFTAFLYKNKLGKSIRSDGSTPVYTSLHTKKQGTPTMGGVLIWGTTLCLAAVFWVLDIFLGFSFFRFNFSDFPFFHGLNFVTRSETLLPIGAMIGAAVVGIADDFLDVRKRGFNGQGIRFRVKVIFYSFVAAVGAWWFYFKLDHHALTVPFLGSIDLGFLYIPIFILIVVGTSFAVDLTDGLDGLAGGTLLTSFLAMAIICYSQGRFNITALIGVVIGSLLAFLWFNIHPARFFMGDTGAMSLGVLLAVVAFLTDTVYLLPFIGIVFVLEAGSIFIQLIWKKIFGYKLFLSSPIHHHFEAKGWPETKVTERLWIISFVGAIFGLVIFFVNRQF